VRRIASGLLGTATAVFVAGCAQDAAVPANADSIKEPALARTQSDMRNHDSLDLPTVVISAKRDAPKDRS